MDKDYLRKEYTMLIKDFFKIASLFILLLANPVWADEDEDEYDDDATLQVQTQLKEGEAELKKAKKTRSKKGKLNALKKAATAFSKAYVQVNGLLEDLDDPDIEEQVNQRLQAVHQEVILNKEMKKLENQALIYLKKKVLTDGQRKKLIDIISTLSNLDSSRREFKQIQELFVPSSDDDDDDEDDEGDEEE